MSEKQIKRIKELEISVSDLKKKLAAEKKLTSSLPDSNYKLQIMTQENKRLKKLLDETTDGYKSLQNEYQKVDSEIERLSSYERKCKELTEEIDGIKGLYKTTQSDLEKFDKVIQNSFNLNTATEKTEPNEPKQISPNKFNSNFKKTLGSDYFSLTKTNLIADENNFTSNNFLSNNFVSNNYASLNYDSNNVDINEKLNHLGEVLNNYKILIQVCSEYEQKILELQAENDEQKMNLAKNQTHIFEIGTNNVKLQEDHKHMQNLRDNLTTTISQLEQMQYINKENNNKIIELSTKSEEIPKLRACLKEKYEELINLQARLQEIETKHVTIENVSNEYEKQNVELTAEVNRLNSTLVEKIKENSRMKIANKETDEVFQSKINIKHKEFESQETLLEEKTQEVSRLKALIGNLEENLNGEMKFKQTLQYEVAKTPVLENQVKITKAQNVQKEDEIFLLNEELDLLRKEKANFHTDNNKLLEDFSRLETNYNDLLKVKEELLTDLAMKNREIGVINDRARENENKLAFISELEQKLRELDSNHIVIEDQCTKYMEEIKQVKNNYSILQEKNEAIKLENHKLRSQYLIFEDSKQEFEQKISDKEFQIKNTEVSKLQLYEINEDLVKLQETTNQELEKKTHELTKKNAELKNYENVNSINTNLKSELAQLRFEILNLNTMQKELSIKYTYQDANVQQALLTVKSENVILKEKNSNLRYELDSVSASRNISPIRELPTRCKSFMSLQNSIDKTDHNKVALANKDNQINDLKLKNDELTENLHKLATEKMLISKDLTTLRQKNNDMISNMSAFMRKDKKFNDLTTENKLMASNIKSLQVNLDMIQEKYYDAESTKTAHINMTHEFDKVLEENSQLKVICEDYLQQIENKAVVIDKLQMRLVASLTEQERLGKQSRFFNKENFEHDENCVPTKLDSRNFAVVKIID